MTVQDVLDIYQAEDNYVPNSMILKSFNDEGCTYKWLVRTETVAFRKELFIATTGTGELEDRTATTYVEIGEAK